MGGAGARLAIEVRSFGEITEEYFYGILRLDTVRRGSRKCDMSLEFFIGYLLGADDDRDSFTIELHKLING